VQQLGRIELPGDHRDERGPRARRKRRGKCGGSAPASGGTIKIGGGFALTGDESALDLPAANGAKLAVKEINAAGGINGSQIDFIVHDSQYKMDVTAQTAKQFVEQDKVPLMIGYTDTDSVLASGPTFQSAGIPFITVGATSPKIPTQVGDMMFLACFGDNVQAAVGAEYSFSKFGKNAYFLWDKGVEYTTLLGQYFKTRFTELGGTIALEESYDDKATDFSAQIAKIKTLSPAPDFYYVAAMPYNIGPIVKQFRDAGLTGPIVGGDGYDTPDLVKVAGPTTSKVFFTTHALMDATAGHGRDQEVHRGVQGRVRQRSRERVRRPRLRHRLSAGRRGQARRAGTDSAAVKTAIEATKDFPGITGKITFAPGATSPRRA
jgi:branched-chain amino acid transport system substrate-binding protein